MPDLRKDPIVGRWVIIATERAKRPYDFKREGHEPDEPGLCPFCEGHEDKTPPEIAAYRERHSRPNRPGWRIRVVPNKFPALKVEGRSTSGATASTTRWPASARTRSSSRVRGTP